MQKKTRAYEGKLFSILGDSISTFESCCLPHHPAFYQHEYRLITGVLEVEDTWWHQVIRYFGGELLVNASWSGCCVTKLPREQERYPSGCSEHRIAELGKAGFSPDVIIVYLGTNDWWYGSFREKPDAAEFFPHAYDLMLGEIKRQYPSAEVWCLSLCESKMTSRHSFVFNPTPSDVPMSEYNKVIETLCRKHGCKWVNTAKYQIAYDSADGVHPNCGGMKTLASLCIIAANDC